jgi:hypothetical protein
MAKLNYQDLKINWKEDIDITDYTLTLALECENDNAIDTIDIFRAERGYNDKASSSNNDVYYNIYLVYSLAINTYHVEVFVNNSEEDDYATYDFELEISESDLRSILASCLLKLANEE